MIGEPIKDANSNILCYVLIQLTESLQNFVITSNTFPSRISSYRVFKGAKIKSFQVSTDSNLKLHIA